MIYHRTASGAHRLHARLLAGFALLALGFLGNTPQVRAQVKWQDPVSLPPVNGTSTTGRVAPVKACLLLAVGMICFVALGGTASAATTDDCSYNQVYGVCTVVTNRAWGFGSTGGQLQTMKLQMIGQQAVRGYWDTGTTEAFDWNGSAIGVFSNNVPQSRVDGPAGNVTYRAMGALGGSIVKVETGWNTLVGPNYAPTCPTAAYLVCVAAQTWEKQIDNGQSPRQIVGLATIESRPLIVKILNLTDQPLVRSSEARGTGVLRDQAMYPRPATVPALADGLAGTGYYHYYRDASVADNVTMSYAFADGTASKALTGGVLDINVDVAADGTTGASACTPPEGLPLTVECKVTMLGSADGILMALVSVGV